MALASGRIGRDIALVDKDGPKARAQALDISDALSWLDEGPRVRTGTYADCADADIVLIAIGEPRLPGQTRLDLLGSSVKMLDELLEVLKPLNLPGIVISITNPADIVADYVRRGLGLSRFRAFGTGTLLDTARLVRLLSDQLAQPRSRVDAVALGEHGDSSMIPFSQVRIGGLPFEAWPGLDKATILGQTRWAGMEIIDGKGSTEFGIGHAVAALCDSIFSDEQNVVPLSVFLDGEYGQHDVHCGVPCRVGRQGIERIVELTLAPAEWDQLNESCHVIRRHIALAQTLTETPISSDSPPKE
jgi:L-lactate dehydrogenase